MSRPTRLLMADGKESQGGLVSHEASLPHSRHQTTHGEPKVQRHQAKRALDDPRNPLAEMT